MKDGEKRKEKLISELVQLRKRVAELEAQLAKISQQLAEPPADHDEVLRLGDDYVEIENELNALIVEWEALQL